MNASYIIAACRTPIGKYLGALSSIPAPQLAAKAISEAVRRAELSPETVEEVILGNVLSAGLGQAPARQAALAAGLSNAIFAETVNKVCGSGLKAVMFADQMIRVGDAECVVAGGMESMSRAPWLTGGMRMGTKFGDQTLIDSMQHDGLYCSLSSLGMGAIGDETARRFGVSRKAQDEFALLSHQRAVSSIEALSAEITPIEITIGKKTAVVSTDEGPRPDSNYETLAGLRPAFATDGTITAGNSSQVSDGAAAVVVVSESLARQSKSAIKAKIVASATAGGPPGDLFIAPVAAIRKAVGKAKLHLGEIDLFELNEAFAAQAVACIQQLELDPGKVNVHGGAIALGHPIGASGARTLVTLLHGLAARNLRRGVVSLCLGGGEAVAMVVERK